MVRVRALLSKRYYPVESLIELVLSSSLSLSELFLLYKLTTGIFFVQDGRLQSGDHILQIGEVNLRGMGSEQVAAVLRQSGSHVRIVVARPVESGNPDYQNLECSAPIVPSSVLADPDELNKYFMSHGYPEINSTPPRSANVLDDYSLCNGANSNLNVSVATDSCF